MLSYIAYRLFQLIPLLLLVSLLTFLIIELPPGDYLSMYIIRLEQSGTRVSEEEARAYYESHPEEFTRQQDEMRASQILVPTLEEANSLRRQIEEGADFSRLARERSNDPSSIQDGDLGYFTREDLLSEISKAVFAAAPGALLKPVKTEFGYHVLLVTDLQKTGTVRPFEMVQDEISGRLSREKERQELDLFLQELRQASSIVQYEQALAATDADQRNDP